VELLAVIGLILSIVGLVRFWKQRREATEQARLKYIDKALSQMHELSLLLDRADRTFTPEYLAELERDLDPATHAALVAKVEHARALRGQPGAPSMPSVGRKLAMAAIDESGITLEMVVDITVGQERIIADLRDAFRPFFRSDGGSA
jgi:hypothetical protein